MTKSALGTLSVLFTDVVGSTAQRVALGDDRADDLHRVHDRLVADAVAAAGGTVVKGLGDGALATFHAAADAVAAAVSIQQHVERHNRGAGEGLAFSVRIGISIGDVTLEDDDVLGTPVVEASRLCSAATGDEILVAELVRMLARGRGGFTFEPIGDLDLKGLSEPVPACRVAWAPILDPSDETGRVPLPPVIEAAPATSYVGRPDLLAQLGEAWKATLAGDCRTVLLAGEPGIGKTRSAAELARTAFAGGATVLYGRCDEDMGVPYQPFVESLDWYVRHSAGGAPLGRLPGELTRLAPELRSLNPGAGGPVASDPRSEEYRLFEAVASWLAEASSASGLVLVLDDLHWAARPTLQLLVHVLRSAADDPQARLLVLATYRDTDVDRSHPLSGVLADLRRLPSVVRVAVQALNRDEVVRFVEVAAAQEIDADTRALAEAVHAETEGNPFFVGEVLRHLVETGAVRRGDDRWVVDVARIDVPEGVRDVVGRRVSRLSAAANDVLSVAAVVGRDVSLEVVTAVSELTEDEVVDAFDEGVRARLLEETGADRFRFAHALVRTTLYEELSATRRRRLHRRVADALEKLHAADVVALAHHTLQAGPDGGDITRAARYGIAAAEQALASRALADAEARFVGVLEMIDDAEVSDDELWLRAMCGLGEAQRDQGDPEFRATLLTASRRAVALGATDLLVRAVLSNARGYASIIGDVDRERVELVEAALDAIGPEPSSDRARLLALLASEVMFAGDHARKRALVTEAEAMARSTGDIATLAHVLNMTAFADVRLDDWDAHLARCREAVAVSDQTGDPSLAVMARLWLSNAELAAGNVAASSAITADMQTMAGEASPAIAWLAQAQSMKFVIGKSDIATSTAANDALLETGRALGAPDYLNWWGAIVAGITYVGQGTISPLLDLIADFARQFPGTRTWQAGIAWALADAGRIDEARKAVEREQLTAASLAHEPFPFYGPFACALVAARTGDLGLAAESRALLEPHRGRWTHYQLVVTGPVEYALGLCASTLGDHDEAVELLTGSVAALRDNDFPLLADAHGQDLAAVLRLRDAPGDRERAAAVLGDILTRTDASGALGLAERCRAMLAEL